MYFSVELVGLGFFRATPLLPAFVTRLLMSIGLESTGAVAGEKASFQRDVNACNTCFSGKCAARQRLSKAYWNVTQRESLRVITCQNNAQPAH